MAKHLNKFIILFILLTLTIKNGDLKALEAISLQNFNNIQGKKPMKEIEIRIQTKEIEKFESWLMKTAQLFSESFQKDIYLEPSSNPFLYQDKEGKLQADKWLRIRQDSSSSKLCLKDVVRNKSGEYLYSEEYETTVENPESLIEIFIKIGFINVIEINKHRKEWKFGDFIVAKDSITELGTFFEIENHSGKSFEDSIEDINLFLRDVIKIDFIRIFGGYPQMIWDKQKLKSIVK